jgi:hypothetical protein
MTTDHPTPDHRASLLLGYVLRRAMLAKGSPSERRAAAWATYTSLCRHELTEEEAIEIRAITGLIDISGDQAPDQ